MMQRPRPWTFCAAFVLALLAGASPAIACPGDCDGDGQVLVDELIRGVNIALGVEDWTSCTALDRDFSSTVTVDEILAAVGAALGGCPAPQRTAFVIASDFETGSFTTVDLAERRVLLPAAPSRAVNADSVAAVFEDRLYVVNRFGLRGDSIQARDPQRGFALESDCSAGASSNPQDIAFVSNRKAFVTRYEMTSLLVVDPSVGAGCEGFVRGTIDLAAYADGDGIPEMERMALVDEVLYVSVQRLGRANLFQPVAPGALVLIDTSSDTIIGAIELRGMNPFGPLHVVGDRLYVSVLGSFGANDGGIEVVDLRARQSVGWLITEAAIGGDVTDFVLVSDELGYAIISDANFRNSLVSFSPRDGTRTRTIFAESSYISQVRLTERGDLYVADRAFARPGLRIFDVRTGVERPGSPLQLGLPPFDILFLR